MLAVKPETAVDYFSTFFRKSADTQLILSFGLWGISLALSILTQDWWWFTGGTLLQLSGPYTIFIIMPVNRRIMKDGADPNSEQMLNDLKQWGRIHFPRTVIAGAIFILFAYLAVTA